MIVRNVYRAQHRDEVGVVDHFCRSREVSGLHLCLTDCAVVVFLVSPSTKVL